MATQGLQVRRTGEIAQRLREEIVSGRIEEGQRLTEAELTARFGVGRGLVREVLQQLSHQGLLVTRPNRGAVVASEAPKEIRDLIVPIRRTVEGYALQMIFDDLGAGDFARWDELLERMHAACRKHDYPSIAETDVAFHHSIVERAGQPDLLAIWEAMAYRIRTHFRRTQRRYPDPMAIYEEHRAILASIRSGDEQAAVKMLTDNIG